MANPAFGSPEWDAKYGVRRGGGSRASSAASKAANFVARRGEKTSSQPSLDSVISGLEGAIPQEPEPADRRELVSALAIIKKVAAKNATEG